MGTVHDLATELANCMNRDLKLVLCGLGLAFALYAIWSVFADMNNATRGTRESIEQLERTRPTTP